MTDHIISFSIGIDDTKIIENVQEKAEQQIIRDIKVEILKQLFESMFYRENVVTTDRSTGEVTVSSSATLKQFAKNVLEETLKEYKDDIIDRAANILANKYKNTKAYKEKMKAVLCDEE